MCFNVFMELVLRPASQKVIYRNQVNTMAKNQKQNTKKNSQNYKKETS